MEDLFLDKMKEAVSEAEEYGDLQRLREYLIQHESNPRALVPRGSGTDVENTLNIMIQKEWPFIKGRIINYIDQRCQEIRIRWKSL